MVVQQQETEVAARPVRQEFFHLADLPIRDCSVVWLLIVFFVGCSVDADNLGGIGLEITNKFATVLRTVWMKYFYFGVADDLPKGFVWREPESIECWILFELPYVP